MYVWSGLAALVCTAILEVTDVALFWPTHQLDQRFAHMSSTMSFHQKASPDARWQLVQESLSPPFVLSAFLFCKRVPNKANVSSDAPAATGGCVVAGPSPASHICGCRGSVSVWVCCPFSKQGECFKCYWFRMCGGFWAVSSSPISDVVVLWVCGPSPARQSLRLWFWLCVASSSSTISDVVVRCVGASGSTLSFCCWFCVGVQS